ncbi:hypothetical protein [Streptomyces sp. NPDC050535]|uniref:hypothetical protein n=1 Tax=Streptomyces sp. NPDC050535 TaxID=3365626 RepID=UPI0037B44991
MRAFDVPTRPLPSYGGRGGDLAGGRGLDVPDPSYGRGGDRAGGRGLDVPDSSYGGGREPVG